MLSARPRRALAALPPDGCPVELPRHGGRLLSFYVWAAFFTDQEVLNTVMIDTLDAEQRLCNHVDRLPVRYDIDGSEKIVTDFDTMIFGASEYAKDGLVPIVEITGKDSPWSARMRGIVEDIFKHAPYETPYGKIPSKNIEVNGELLQILPRLYGMTGDRQYLHWAHRLADYYLLPGKFVPATVVRSWCEIIGGLGLLFAVDAKACPDKCRQYRPHLEYLFDQVLQRGRNSDGVIVGTLQETPGPHDSVTLRDGWGYDLVGFLDYDLALGTHRYDDAVRQPLTNLLKPRYFQFNWDSGSRDNVADSVEGGLYLLRRFPTPEGFVWADREIATLLVDHTDPSRLWGVHKLEANTVRTVLIHTMLHTRNTLLRPWASGPAVGSGAVRARAWASASSRPSLTRGGCISTFPAIACTWLRAGLAANERRARVADRRAGRRASLPDSGCRRRRTQTLTGKALAEGMPVRVRAGCTVAAGDAAGSVVGTRWSPVAEFAKNSAFIAGGQAEFWQIQLRRQYGESLLAASEGRTSRPAAARCRPATEKSGGSGNLMIGSLPGPACWNGDNAFCWSMHFRRRATAVQRFLGAT